MSNNKKTNLYPFFSLALCLALFAGCGPKAPAAAADIVDLKSVENHQLANYKTQPAVSGTMTVPVVANGSISRTNSQIIHFSQSGGRIKQVYIRNMQSIKQGDLIAESVFDQEAVGSAISQLLLQMQNDAVSAKAARQALVSSINDGTKEYTAKNAQLAKAVTKEQSSQLSNDIRIAKIKVDALNENLRYTDVETGIHVQELQDQLNKLQAQLEGEKLYAPFDGIAMNVTGLAPGRLVDPSTVIAQVISTEGFLIRMGGDKNAVHYGQAVTVDFGALGKYPGHIVSDPTISGASDVQLTYLVNFDESVDVMSIRGAMPQNATIAISAEAYHIENAVLVPTAGVRVEDTKRYVYIYEDGVRKKRYVQIGESNQDQTQIIAGVREGDQIILNN